MRHGLSVPASILLALTTAACGAAPQPAPEPIAVVVAPPPPEPTASAEAPPSPPPNEPLKIVREATPAPWLERASAPFELWEQSPPAGGIIRMRNPILGDTHAVAIEPGVIILECRVGMLAITRDGVRGLVPKDLRFVGITATGEVYAETSARAPLSAPSVDALVAGKTTPLTTVSRIFDAAGNYVVALQDGALVRSSDAGKTFSPLAVKGTVDRALVRADGVVLASITGASPTTTWFTVSAKGKALPVRRALVKPMRWGGYIFDELSRDGDDEADAKITLTRDGTPESFAHVRFPDEVKGAEFISFHPLFLGAPTENTRSWEGDKLVSAPKKPKAPKANANADRLAMILASSDMAVLGSLSGNGVPANVIGGVIGTGGGGSRVAGGPTLRCQGLKCIGMHRPLLPPRDGSTLVARFFDDGLCKGPVSGSCVPGPLLRPPTIGLFQRDTRALTFQPTPASCEPVSLESMRGLVVLDCKNERWTSDGKGPFAREMTLDPAQQGSFRHATSEDGTMLIEMEHQKEIVGAVVRAPVAPGASGAFRTVTRPGAVAYVVLNGGAVLVAISSDAGDKLTLTIDAPEGKTELVSNVPVARAVRAIRLNEGVPELLYADGKEPPSAKVSRGGALLEKQP
ncbi:MAG: hypothetical protein U0359_08635 [Byssovorax sp.]